jgi:glycosyltransferase involved in cell wall biosynthesis
MIGHYLPGYKAGGPIRSIANLVDALGDEFDFRILTSDRDLGDGAPYAGIPVNHWVRVGKAEVMYLPPRLSSIWSWIRAIRETEYDCVYMNSLFARGFSILPRLAFHLFPGSAKSILLAPRGELSSGALRVKPWRKRLFLAVARWCGIYNGVLWHASSIHERADICRAFFSPNVGIAKPLAVLTASDIPGQEVGPDPFSRKRRKPAGELRLVFLSRISRMKNLHGALEILKGIQGRVLFTIYGPAEDQGYWTYCLSIAAQLPSNVQVHYAGEIHPWQVKECLSEHDVFFLPTFGENFGHVIIEAMLAGCPVVISDQTAWRDLVRKGVGWDLPLHAPERFRDALQAFVDMGPDDLAALARRSYEFGSAVVCDPALMHENRELLYSAVLGRTYRSAPGEQPTLQDLKSI